MRRSHHRNTAQRPAIRILQANVGRGGPAHDILLHHAADNNYDIVLVQEPWTCVIRGKRATKSHRLYTTFTPSDNWQSNRPRCMTYVRIQSHLRPVQIYAGATHDMIVTRLNTHPALEVTNVYRPPGGNAQDDLQTLLSRPVAANSIIAGDFNLHSDRWEADVTRSPGVGVFEDWMDHHNLSLALPYNVPTHRAGHTIDLVLSNRSGVTASVVPHANSTSDHESIAIEVPLCTANSPPPAKSPELTDESAELLGIALAQVTPPPLEANAHSLDRAITRATQMITAAFTTASPPRPPLIPCKSWWNEDCDEARRQWHQARRGSDYDETVTRPHRLAFRKACKRAKRQLQRKRIEECDSSTAAHRLVGMRKLSSKFGAPPIHHEGATYSTPQEKADIFFRTKLSRPATIPDLELGYTTAAQRCIDVPVAAPEAEVHDCLLKVQSTSPGYDGLSTKTLRAVWEVLTWRRWIVHLYNLCLVLGHHPKPFRTAEVVVIPKPHKDDLTTPKNWRPISLLPCLGKGLERLMARRFATYALQAKIIHPQQFGGLPGRAATDLVDCLVHDIESCWERRKVCTLITMDVEGAYDSIQPHRLAARLRDQGWPDNMVRWALSFSSQRCARFRLDDFTSDTYNIPFGLPQGSPASPILFSLFLEPLFQLVDGFGYVDDLAFLGTGTTLALSSEEALVKANVAIQFCGENGLALAHHKSELQHFHRSRGSGPSVSLNNVVLVPNRATRWLGVYLDTKLSFKTHVNTWAASAQKVSGHVRRLGNTVRGAPPYLMRIAVLAAAMPVLTYGASIWWRGRTCTSRGRSVQTGDLQLLNRITTPLRNIARAIVPAYRTAQTAALLRESYILPPQILLDDIRRKSAIRLASVDSHHPAARRAASGKSTRLVDKIRLIPELPRLKILPHAYCSPVTIQRRSELTIVEAAEQIRRLPHMDIKVFSDGSKGTDGRTGAAAYVMQAGRTIAEVRIPLGTNMEVYDAEIVGAVRGLEAAMSSPGTHLATSIHVLLDNQKAIGCLLTQAPSRTSQSDILQFRRRAKDWPSRQRYPSARPGSVNVIWIPGHAGIQGNERADALARDARTLTPPSPLCSLAAALRLAKEKSKAEVNTWWSKEAPSLYRELGITFPSSPPPELRLPRRHFGYLIQCRTGHGDFESYHERFNHTDSSNRCGCGQPKSGIHFAFCQPARRAASTITRGSLGAIDFLLGTPKGAIKFSKFLEDSHFLTRYAVPNFSTGPGQVVSR